MSMMETITGETFDEERALYRSRGIKALRCAFDGPADGESAFKESEDIEVEGCFFNLRYPFWHDRRLAVRGSEMTPLCRAALWYSEDILIEDTMMHGIKALRECRRADLIRCDIVSPEFGWSTERVSLTDCAVESEYFLMRAGAWTKTWTSEVRRWPCTTTTPKRRSRRRSTSTSTAGVPQRP